MLFFPSLSSLQWRIIAGGTKCIPKSELPVEDDDPQSQPAAPPSSRLWLHPSDLSIALSASTPLYPPGRIIHVVHNHPPETWWGKLILYKTPEVRWEVLARKAHLCTKYTSIPHKWWSGCITDAWTQLTQSKSYVCFTPVNRYTLHTGKSVGLQCRFTVCHTALPCSSVRTLISYFILQSSCFLSHTCFF